MHLRVLCNFFFAQVMHSFPQDFDIVTFDRLGLSLQMEKKKLGK